MLVTLLRPTPGTTLLRGTPCSPDIEDCFHALELLPELIKLALANWAAFSRQEQALHLVGEDHQPGMPLAPTDGPLGVVLLCGDHHIQGLAHSPELGHQLPGRFLIGSVSRPLLERRPHVMMQAVQLANIVFVDKLHGLKPLVGDRLVSNSVAGSQKVEATCQQSQTPQQRNHNREGTSFGHVPPPLFILPPVTAESQKELWTSGLGVLKCTLHETRMRFRYASPRHGRVKSPWRDGRGVALAQLLDHVQHFLLSQDAFAL